MKLQRRCSAPTYSVRGGGGCSKCSRLVNVIKWHVQLLARYIGYLEPRRIHDATLEPFSKDRLSQGASATTVKRTIHLALLSHRSLDRRSLRKWLGLDGYIHISIIST